MLGMSEAKTRAPGIYNFWYEQIVQLYTDRHLTKESDRLPAISALASTMQNAVLDDYLAGLWRHDLVRGLLWTTRRSPTSIPSQSSARRTREYRAPSWSWVSVQGAVDYSHLTVEPDCITILDVRCDLKSANSTGEVCAGWLQVVGPITCASLIVDYEASTQKATFALFQEGFDDIPIQSNIWLDTPIQEVEVLDSSGEMCCTAHRAMPESNAQEQPVFGTVTCLLVAESISKQTGKLVERYFLILGRSQTYPGAYERLGLLRANRRSTRVPLDESSWSRVLEQKELLIY